MDPLIDLGERKKKGERGAYMLISLLYGLIVIIGGTVGLGVAWAIGFMIIFLAYSVDEICKSIEKVE